MPETEPTPENREYRTGNQPAYQTLLENAVNAMVAKTTCTTCRFVRNIMLLAAPVQGAKISDERAALVRECVWYLEYHIRHHHVPVE